MTLATIGWPDVMVALIAGLPAIIAALAAISVHRQIQTPSGKNIGKQVEDVNHTSRSNWHTLNAMGRALGGKRSVESAREAAIVEGLDAESRPTE
jgi:hypothetical protein